MPHLDKLENRRKAYMTTQQKAIGGTKLILIVSALWLGMLGGRGNLVGSYPDTGIFFLAANFTWKF
jgi:hypothetical protein